jgi:hypothetical protein
MYRVEVWYNTIRDQFPKRVFSLLRIPNTGQSSQIQLFWVIYIIAKTLSILLVFEDSFRIIALDISDVDSLRVPSALHSENLLQIIVLSTYKCI